MESQAPEGFPEDLDEIAKLYSNCFLSFRETDFDSTKSIEDEIDPRSPWFNSASGFFSRIMKCWYRILIEITTKGTLIVALDLDSSDDKRKKIIELQSKVDEEHKKTPKTREEIFKANQWWKKIVSDYDHEINIVLKQRYPQLDLKIDSFNKSKHVAFRNMFEHYEDKGRRLTDKAMKDRMQRFLEDPLERIYSVASTFVQFCCSINRIDISEYEALVEKYNVSKHNMNTVHKKQAVLEMFDKLDWTEYYGSDDRINEFNDLLNNASVISMTGIGGLGKTALAIQIVRKRIEDFEYFPFITSKSSEQGHGTFTNVNATFEDPRNQNVHAGIFANKYQNMIDILLEIDTRFSDVERNRMPIEEKTKHVIELFNKEQILCIMDNYEDIQDGANLEEKKLYKNFIDAIMKKDEHSVSKLIITSRAEGAGATKEVEPLIKKDIKDLLIARIRWLGNRFDGANIQKIADSNEIMQRIENNIDIQLESIDSENEINLWSHPLFILYIALRVIDGKTNVALLFDEISKEKDIEVDKIADYVVRKTFDLIKDEELKDFLKDWRFKGRKSFSTSDMSNWFKEQRTGQIDDLRIREFIIQLISYKFIKESDTFRGKRAYTMTDMLIQFLKPNNRQQNQSLKPLVMVRKKVDEGGVEASRDTEWIIKIDEKIQSKTLTRLSGIAGRKPEKGGYEQVIKNTITCIQAVKAALNNPLYDTDYKNLLTAHLFQLIDHQNRYINDSSVIVSNIAEIFTIENLEYDLCIEAKKALSTLHTRVTSEKSDKVSPPITNQILTQKTLKALFLIYGCFDLSENSTLTDDDKDFLVIWHEWYQYIEGSDFYETLISRNNDDYIEKAIFVALKIIKNKPKMKDTLENWIIDNKKRVSNLSLLAQINETISKQELTYDDLKNTIYNNEKIEQSTISYLPINEVMTKDFNSTSIIEFKRSGSNGNCEVTITRIEQDDDFDKEKKYKVEFINVDYKFIYTCKLIRDEKGKPISNDLEDEIFEDDNLKNNRELLRKYIIQNLDSDGYLDDLFKKVSESIRDESPDNSYKNLKKKAGLNSKKLHELMDELVPEYIQTIEQDNWGKSNNRAYYTSIKEPLNPFVNPNSSTKPGNIKSKKKTESQPSPQIKVEDIPFPPSNIFKLIFENFVGDYIIDFHNGAKQDTWDDKRWQDQEVGFKANLKRLKQQNNWLSLNSKQINQVNQCLRTILKNKIDDGIDYTMLNKSKYKNEISSYLKGVLLKKDEFGEKFVGGSIEEYLKNI